MSAPTTLNLTGTWDVDPAHTRLGFAARHAMVATVRGGFDVFSGTIVLDQQNPAASHAEVEIRTTINRKDWGLTWNVAIEGGGILVGDKIKIELDVSAIKRVAPA